MEKPTLLSHWTSSVAIPTSINHGKRIGICDTVVADVDPPRIVLVAWALLAAICAPFALRLVDHCKCLGGAGPNTFLGEISVYARHGD